MPIAVLAAGGAGFVAVAVFVAVVMRQRARRRQRLGAGATARNGATAGDQLPSTFVQDNPLRDSLTTLTESGARKDAVQETQLL